MKKETSFGSWLRHESAELATLLRSVPPLLTILFVATVIVMNFLSRITVLSLPWIALNAGIYVSWLLFLLMDIVAKHYGAKAANMLSLLAIAANLATCLVCFIISRVWNRPELDMVVGGQWSVLTASTIAYVASALVNNYSNVFIGRFFRENPDGKAAYVTRSYVSTLLSQIVDNFLFLFLAFVLLPDLPGALQVRWTVLQCLGSALTCAVFELLTEVVFSPLGYCIVRRWKETGVGREYISKYCPGGCV